MEWYWIGLLAYGVVAVVCILRLLRNMFSTREVEEFQAEHIVLGGAVDLHRADMALDAFDDRIVRILGVDTAVKGRLKIYIAGPMTGIPKYNFPAFHAATADLRERGHKVRSPAERDIKMGFDAEVQDTPPPGWSLGECLRWDLKSVLWSDAVVLLAGWESSPGAACEVATARWTGRELLLYPELTVLPPESVLAEADRLVSGDRQSSYGHPRRTSLRPAGSGVPS